jgi:hypothetical protein
MKLKQLALTASVGAGLLAASLPSQAIIVGAAGEAYLIPLVIYQSTGPGRVNTLIQVTVPGSMGEETIPNDFTALNVGAYNCEKDDVGACVDPPTLFPSTVDVTDEDPVDENYIHWAFFDENSKHVCNNEFKITPDDFAGINWGSLVENNNCNAVDGQDVDGLPGYMVLSNDSSYKAGGNADPQFAFFADAYLVTANPGGLSPTWGTVAAKIPTLPMSDGNDEDSLCDQGVPTPVDSVCYNGDNINVSPLIAGMRTNRSDGKTSRVFWDLTLSTRRQPTMHVVWMDRLYNDESVDEDENQIQIARSLVFDSHEESCSGPAPKLYELTTIWIEPLPGGKIPKGEGNPPTIPEWATYSVQACDPVAPNGGDTSPFQTADVPGFILYGMDEPIDTNADRPESAGVAFAIQFNTVIDTTQPNVIPVETAFGHERGLFAE